MQAVQDYSYYMTYFGNGELKEVITQLSNNDPERAGEDALAASLFSCPKDTILRLLPEYLESIDRLRQDTLKTPDPKPAYMQFSSGSPTWLRLAWKCRSAYEQANTPVIAADEFFTAHKEQIDAHEERKFGYTRKTRELFPDRDFFAMLCGKPFAKEPYATAKHFARSLFRIQDDNEFVTSYTRYVDTLVHHRDTTKQHPDIVSDLLKRLSKEAQKEENATRYALVETVFKRSIQ